MDITPAIPDGKKLVEAYGQRRFRIAGILYDQAVLLTGDDVWPLAAITLDDITLEMLHPLLGLPVELLLLGTGARQQFAAPALKAALRERGITLEAMTSDAACRTYNVLLAEGRPVAAALLPL